MPILHYDLVANLLVLVFLLMTVLGPCSRAYACARVGACACFYRLRLE